MRGTEVLQYVKKSGSQLCIGLDPSPKLSTDDKISFCLDIIGKTHRYAVGYKPNRQFLLGLSIDQMREITQEIHRRGKIAIMDHKLSDIGSTNKAALELTKEEGFDLITVSPFPGNIRETAQNAHELNLGVIVLTLMSNPEARWMSEEMFVRWAKESEEYADGMVVGTTNHVESTHLEKIAEVAPTKFVLAPGIGAQGGKVEEIMKVFGERTIFNVSRGIIRSEDPELAAKNYFEMIDNAKKRN